MSSEYDAVADDSWFDDLDDLDDVGEGTGTGDQGGSAGGSWADGWLAGANATRCSCPVKHPPSCGSYEAPQGWAGRLVRRVLLGGGRR